MPGALPPAGAHQEPGRLRAHLSRVGRAAGKILGRNRRTNCTGSRSGTRFWNGKLPGPNGLSAARLNISYNCLDRHVQTARKNKAAIDLGERTRRGPHSHLRATSSRSAEVRQRPEIAGRQKRRPGRHLHGHDPRAAHRHAGLRPHRRAAHGGLRRILLERSGRSHSRLPGRRRHHPGRLLPPRRRGQTISRSRGSAEVVPVGEARGRLPANRNARSTCSPAATTGGTN